MCTENSKDVFLVTYEYQDIAFLAVTCFIVYSNVCLWTSMNCNNQYLILRASRAEKHGQTVPVREQHSFGSISYGHGPHSAA